MIGKCTGSNINLWLKRIVCEVLKGICTIWIEAKEKVYNMMRPRFSLNDLEKQDNEHEEEGSIESEDDREGRNLRTVLHEEIEASFICYVEDNERLRQTVVNEARYKDLTEVPVIPNFDSKQKVEKAEEDESQI
jgi:hypothetical protein